MSTNYTPLPAVGDIVWCHFPEEVDTPGPKSRPALVVAISTSQHAVQVAYGTSKKTFRLYPGEFVLDPQDKGFLESGLETRTKFDLGNLIKLPFDTTWFADSPLLTFSSPKPKMGSLHVSYMGSARRAKQAYEEKKRRDKIRIASND